MIMRLATTILKLIKNFPRFLLKFIWKTLIFIGFLTTRIPVAIAHIRFLPKYIGQLIQFLRYIPSHIRALFQFLKKKFIFITIGTLSIFLTIFIFLSSAELIFNQNFEYIDSIKDTPLSSEIDYKIQQAVDATYRYSFETLFENRELRYVEIPVINRKLELSRAIQQDGEWLAKGNKANYIVVKNSKNQDNIIVYFQKSWRTFMDTGSVKLGDFIFLTTNDSWNYIFRIDSINTYSYDERFPTKAYDAMSVTLIMEDNETKGYQVYEAKIVSSRGDE
jgi:hypothetical protein